MESSKEFDKNLWEERHENILKENKSQNKILDNHENRIGVLEQYRSRSEEKIDNLCRDLRGLTSTLKWFIGLLIGSFVAFFFYAVQTHLFK